MSIGTISLALRRQLDVDEDVSIRGNTVTWFTEKKVRKSVSVDYPVIHTEWTYFSSSHSQTGSEPYLVIVQKRCLTVLGTSGSMYHVTLPFPVQKVFSFGLSGLLLQRDIGNIDSDDSPQIFSLLHPLCEPHPVCVSTEPAVPNAEPGTEAISCTAAPTMQLMYVASWGAYSQCPGYHTLRNVALTFDSTTGKYGMHEIRHEPSTENDMAAPIDPPLRPQIGLHELWSAPLFSSATTRADKVFDAVLRDGSLRIYILHRDAKRLECVKAAVPPRPVLPVIHGNAVDNYRSDTIVCEHGFQLEAIDAACVDAFSNAVSRYSSGAAAEATCVRARADLPRSDLVVVHPTEGIFLHQESQRVLHVELEHETPSPSKEDGRDNAPVNVRSIAAAGSHSCTVGVGAAPATRYIVEFHLQPRSPLVRRIFTAFELLVQQSTTALHTAQAASVDTDAYTSVITCSIAPTCLAVLQRMYYQRAGQSAQGGTRAQADWHVLEAVLDAVFQCTEASSARVSADSAWDKVLAMTNGTHYRTETLVVPAGDAATLNAHLGGIFFVLHAVYEDSKLSTLLDSTRWMFARLLLRVSCALGLEAYASYYAVEGRGFGVSATMLTANPIATLSVQTTTSLLAAAGPTLPDAVTCPPQLRPWLHALLQGNAARMVFPVVAQTPPPPPLGNADATFLSHAVGTVLARLATLGPCADDDAGDVWAAVGAAAARGLTREHVECMPVGIAAPLEMLVRRAVHCVDEHVPSALLWSGRTLLGTDVWKLVVARYEQAIRGTTGAHYDPTPSSAAVADDDADDDGTAIRSEHVRRRFASDLRIKEVQRLLVGSKPCRVRTEQTPEMSDHDFAAEQKAQLLLVVQRTLATSVGRGMFTLNTVRPIITQAIRIPPLNTTGKGMHGAAISLDDTTLTAEHLMWPRFHNGVAAGLRVARPSEASDSTDWIAYHRPKGNQLNDEHAGFIMALGMLGHLQNINAMTIFDYLIKCHDTTSVGVLLGMAAAAKGTMDPLVAKMLSIHVPALLPATTADIEVALMVQSAAIVGVGLLYQETCHRRITQVLVDEIGRTNPDNDDTDNCSESYALGAGLALGMVTLGRGDFAGIADLRLSDRLRRYMDGGTHGTTPRVNVDITGPGATIALGLAYLKTNSSAIATRLEIPSTEYQLDFIRPDCVLLRVLSHSLVLWDAITPTVDWAEGNCPALVRQHSGFARTAAGDAPTSHGVDADLMRNTYVSACAGSCLAIGLRYAGSSNVQAAETLTHYLNLLLRSGRRFTHTGRSILQTCTNVVLMSLALVHAGSGDLPTMRFIRKLHKRVTPDVTYGSHMAVHAALGLLFLGGGAYTIDTSTNAGIAAVIASLFPQFPNNTVDNRYHLQALRHMYAMATVHKSTATPSAPDAGRMPPTPLCIPLARAYELELAHAVSNFSAATAHDLRMLFTGRRTQGPDAGWGTDGPHIYAPSVLATAEEVVHRTLHEAIPAVATALRECRSPTAVVPAAVAAFLAYHEIPSLWRLWTLATDLRETGVPVTMARAALFAKTLLPAASAETVLAVATVVQTV
eukprot:m.576909 g.576909  ORF g.576909 m.576909 type:complete len:1553 (-) comp22291_c1_seq1:277-4935(-)